MKTIKLFKAIALVMALAWMSSCSKSDSAMFDYISGDEAMVINIDALTVLENAGFKVSSKGIEAPKALKDKEDGDLDRTMEVLNGIKGLDPRSIIFVISEKGADTQAYAIAKLTDVKDFEKSLEDMDCEKSTDGKLTLFKLERRSTIAVDGSIAILLDCKVDDAADIIDDLKAKSAENPLPSWQQSLISDLETMTMVMSIDKITQFDSDARILLSSGILNKLYDGDVEDAILGVKVELDDLELKAESKVYSSTGKVMKSALAMDKIDKSLLKYTSTPQFVTGLFSLSLNDELKELLDDAAGNLRGTAGEAAQDLIKALTGRFMISFGYDDLNSMMYRSTFSAVMALQANKGKGNEALDDIKDLLNSNRIPYTTKGDDLKISMGYQNIYIVLDGDNLVVSMEPDLGNGKGAVKSGDFDNVADEIVLRLPANNEDLTGKELPFGIEAKAITESDCAKLTVKLTDTKGKFLENIINLAAE